MRSQCCTVIGQPHKLRELIKPTYVRLSASLGKVAGPWSNDFLSLLTAGGARRLPTRVTLSSYRLEPNWEGTVWTPNAAHCQTDSCSVTDSIVMDCVHKQKIHFRAKKVSYNWSEPIVKSVFVRGNSCGIQVFFLFWKREGGLCKHVAFIQPSVHGRLDFMLTGAGYQLVHDARQLSLSRCFPRLPLDKT